MRGLTQAEFQAKRSVKRRIAEKETLNPAVIAKVGNGTGTVVVSGRPGWIHVRLHGDDNQLTDAKLGIPLDTASLDDAWVRVKKASPRKASYYVVQEFVTSSTGNPTPPMSAHPLDPDDGPHTGALTEDDVVFDDAAGHDHQGAGNKGTKVGHPDLLGVTTDQHHPKIHAPAHKSGGEQPLDVKELVDSEGRLLTGAQKTDLTDGGMTVLHQHAGGATASVLITLINRTGGQRTAGDVVVTDPSNDESFVGTAVVGYQGKVLVVGETIADLTGGLCWERGGPFDTKVTGAVDRNDGLRTSATIYRAEAAPSVTGGGVFAVALSPNISGEGTVKAVFLDALGGGGGVGTIEIQEDDAKVADAHIVNFEGGGGKVTDEGGGKVTVDITPGAGADISARVYHNAAQSIPNVTYTSLVFNSERFDTDGIHDPAVNNSRLTCKTAGKYQITINIGWDGNATNRRILRITLNGTTVIAQVEYPIKAYLFQFLTTLWDLDVDDYVEARVYQSSGGNRDVLYADAKSPEFMMVKVG